MSEPLLYLTADRIGEPSGGGVVTDNECLALHEFGASRNLNVKTFGREELTRNPDEAVTSVIGEPWVWDQLAYHKFGPGVRLAHVYSGTFSESVRRMKAEGTKVVYTVAAHSIDASRKAHLDLGLPYPYNHLTDPLLWCRYSAGYWLADAVVVPSTYSERVVQEQHQTLFGSPHPKVVVIPHGCHIPEKIAPLPKRFVVGYLGSCGAADKGVRYLLEAWKKLNYKDSYLMLAGRDSLSDWVGELIARFGGGAIFRGGWVKDVSDFYDRCSLYVQPSVTEAFGIEVLEAMAHGRPVVCSEGAGSVDLVDDNSISLACDASYLADKISQARWVYDHDLYPLKEGKLVVDPAFPTGKMDLTSVGLWNRGLAEKYDWKLIWQKYQALYAELLGG